jgi:hypothetical protein
MLLWVPSNCQWEYWSLIRLSNLQELTCQYWASIQTYRSQELELLLRMKGTLKSQDPFSSGQNLICVLSPPAYLGQTFVSISQRHLDLLSLCSWVLRPQISMRGEQSAAVSQQIPVVNRPFIHTFNWAHSMYKEMCRIKDDSDTSLVRREL